MSYGYPYPYECYPFPYARCDPTTLPKPQAVPKTQKQLEDEARERQDKIDKEKRELEETMKKIRIECEEKEKKNKADLEKILKDAKEKDNLKYAYETLSSYFTFRVLVPTLNALHPEHAGSWEKWENNLAEGRLLSLVDRTLDNQWDLPFESFVKFINAYPPKRFIQTMHEIIFCMWTVGWEHLGKYFYDKPDDDSDKAKIFLAAFGSFGESEGLWKSIAEGLERFAEEENSKLTDKEEKNSTDENENENTSTETITSTTSTSVKEEITLQSCKNEILYMWTSQIFLGLCKIKTRATVQSNPFGISLDSKDINLFCGLYEFIITDKRSKDPIIHKSDHPQSMVSIAVSILGINHVYFEGDTRTEMPPKGKGNLEWLLERLFK